MSSSKNRVYTTKVCLEFDVIVTVPGKSTVKSAIETKLAEIASQVAPLGQGMVISHSHPQKSGEVAEVEADTFLKIWTDGGCYPNPGPGGWGVHAVLPDGHVIEKNGHSAQTTNNIMEITAAMHGAELIPKGEFGVIHTDSKYVIDGITSWIHKWKRNGWKTGTNEPVKNQEYWKDLDKACQGRNIHWQWVKGHSGIPQNERADELATLGKQGKIVK